MVANRAHETHRTSSNRRSNRSSSNAREKTFDLSKLDARVDRVNVSGLLRTHNDYVMKAAAGLFKAKNFEEIMFESMNAKSYLHELGIFKDITVHIDVSRGDSASPNGYEVTFKGRELSRIVGSVGTEVGQNEGSLRTELTIPNLFGRGESISLQGSYSNRKANEIQLKFWKCYFHTKYMENRPELSFSIFRHLQRYDISKFQSMNIGCLGEFAVNTRLPVPLTHSIQLETAIREMSLLDKGAPISIRQHCGPKMASLIRYSLIYDQRDDRVFPTSGILLKTVNEYCGLMGNVHYTATCGHAEFNLPIYGGIVAQICGRVGLIRKTAKTRSLPLESMFYCGGPLTLRGFKYGGAGPVVEGTPIGANTYWSSAVHLWTPLPFQRVFKGFANNIRTHFFYNFGNFDNFSTENMRTSVGMGLAFKLVERARIELNYCIPLRSCKDDRTHKGFQFGIGYEFV